MHVIHLIMTISFSKVTLGASGITESKFGGLQAEIVQTVTTSYPSAKAESSTSGSIFAEDELGFEAKEFTSTRTFWAKVSDKITEEAFEARLLEFPEARLVRNLYSAPHFTAEHLASLDGLQVIADKEVAGSPEHTKAVADVATRKASIVKSQLVVYGKTHAKANQPILFQDKPGQFQYKRIDFKPHGGEDIDLRSSTSELDAR